MLIRFKVSNFLSFKEETEFSMVASPERIHSNHVVKGKNQPNLLRSALLYGANAAGKSNFVKAVDFAKDLIIKRREVNEGIDFEWRNVFGDEFEIEFDRNKFRLDKNYAKKPSNFSFELISNERVFLYSFSLDSEKIIDEKLVEFVGDIEKLLFERKINEHGNTVFAETDFLKKKEDKEFLRFVQRSTLSTELFLTHSTNHNFEWFKDVFEWFYYSLNTIFPDTKDYVIGRKLYKSLTFRNYFINLMRKVGTGILSVELKPNKNPKLLRKVDGNHHSTDFVDLKLIHNDKVKFEEVEESDGTQRLFDLAFPFYDLATSETPKVYIIDELERNLHTNLSYMLLKSYLEQSGKGQLIATTHDTHLLDLDLLRRDEIWFAEKDEHGATQLYSLYDFNPRYDKDIEKDYLLGRYGAIPFLGNLEFKRKLGKNGNSKNGKEK